MTKDELRQVVARGWMLPATFPRYSQAVVDSITEEVWTAMQNDDKRIEVLESDVRMLKDMLAEQTEQIASLYALLNKLDPPGPIVPYAEGEEPWSIVGQIGGEWVIGIDAGGSTYRHIASVRERSDAEFIVALDRQRRPNQPDAPPKLTYGNDPTWPHDEGPSSWEEPKS